MAAMLSVVSPVSSATSTRAAPIARAVRASPVSRVRLANRANQAAACVQALAQANLPSVMPLLPPVLTLTMLAAKQLWLRTLHAGPIARVALSASARVALLTLRRVPSVPSALKVYLCLLPRVWPVRLARRPMGTIHFGKKSAPGGRVFGPKRPRVAPRLRSRAKVLLLWGVRGEEAMAARVRLVVRLAHPAFRVARVVQSVAPISAARKAHRVAKTSALAAAPRPIVPQGSLQPSPRAQATRPSKAVVSSPLLARVSQF
jgi:hypothetical protein